MLVALLNDERVEACDTVERENKFMCPGCGSKAILKRGRIKIPHFAHHDTIGCGYSQGETIAHLTAKRAFCDAARERGLRAEVEYPLGDQRADVAIWSPDGDIAVIELQHTNIEVDELKRRISGYRKMRVPHIWVSLIDGKYFDYEYERDARRVIKDIEICYVIERYSPKPFERYLMKAYNHLWFYSYYHNEVVRGIFDYCHLRRDTDWEGAWCGISKSRRWKKLLLDDFVSVDSIRFSIIRALGIGLEMFYEGQ